MTTDRAAIRDEYVTERPYLVCYWDEYNRPLGYTSHFTAEHAETTAAARLGRIDDNGATVARVTFAEIDTPGALYYTPTTEEMEF